MDERTIRTLSIWFALLACGPAVRTVRGDGRTTAPLVARAAPPLASLLDGVSTPEQRAERAFLEHLGWRLVRDPAATRVVVAGGTPSKRADLASAQARGDLRVVFPMTVTADELRRFAASLPEVADSIASRAAWQFLVAPAVERATSKLAANAACGNWTFPQWLVMNAQVFSMTTPDTGWVRYKKICCARRSPSTAVEAFYTQSASTECFVAQTIASYAIQYEIYGPRWFDEVFSKDEIAIGQVGPFHATPFGRSMVAPKDYPWRALFLRPSDYGEDLGLVLARLGPLAFPGLTGILMDQDGRSRSNQNFTFVSVSEAAAAALVRHGGFGVVAERTRELLDLHLSTRGPFVTASDLIARRASMDATLADPVLQGIRVYIHPYGVVSLAEMAAKLLRRDRTAVQLVLYDEAREDAFFQRYRRAWEARWANAQRLPR